MDLQKNALNAFITPNCDIVDDNVLPTSNVEEFFKKSVKIVLIWFY